MRVYFNEYNIPRGNTIYLPLASGMLKAYAERFPWVKNNYKFMPFIFKRDTVDNIVAQHQYPDIACFSVSLWNYNLSYAVAKKIKEQYPLCTIIFGGPNAPKLKPNFIDHIIHGYGEASFATLLRSCKILLKDINDFPSPYLTGQFDYLLNDGTDYQAIVETNRGCHHGCYYCYWGNGKKIYEFFNMQRIKDEAEWMGRNKIRYIFCADSNFGTFKRDVDIAQIYSDVKAKYGYPDKFRVCYGKANTENIFNTARILSRARLAKSITMSRQTNDRTAMINVNRENIKKDDFDSMQKKYEDKGIYTYSEFILGLPGETLASFKAGIMDAMLTQTKLFIYHCTVLPNTEMAKPEYQEKHGIKTVRAPMAEIHCEPRPEGSVIEYEDIIVETNTMSQEDWIECAVFAWTVQLHKLGEINLPRHEALRFYAIARGILRGIPKGQLDPKFGNIYWEPEELAYLHIMYKDGDPIEFAKQEILYGRK